MSEGAAAEDAAWELGAVIYQFCRHLPEDHEKLTIRCSRILLSLLQPKYVLHISAQSTRYCDRLAETHENHKRYAGLHILFGLIMSLCEKGGRKR